MDRHYTRRSLEAMVETLNSLLGQITPVDNDSVHSLVLDYHQPGDSRRCYKLERRGWNYTRCDLPGALYYRHSAATMGAMLSGMIAAVQMSKGREV